MMAVDVSYPRALIVGAAGQVGTQMMRQLGPAALGAGRTSAPPSHLAGDWLQVDLASLSRAPSSAHDLLSDLPLSAIYCVAGATDVERCETDPKWAFDINTHGPAALAAACPRTIPFIYFSTEYVFDGASGPYSETDTPRAISVYGNSKLEGEQRVLAARPDALIIRTTVVYGPDPAAKNFLYFLHRQLSAGMPTRIVTDQISTPTSNDDLAAATIALAQRGHTGIVHVCGPDLLSRYDFAVRAVRVLGLDSGLLEPIPTASLHQRAPRPLSAGLSITKLRSLVKRDMMKATEAGVAAWQHAAFPDPPKL